MKLNLEEMKLDLERLAQTDLMHKGAQPELTIGCFMDLETDSDKICRRCRNYESCYSYLKAYEKKEEIFRR